MHTLSALLFCLFAFLASTAVFLSQRLYRIHHQPFLQAYTLHLAFWNGHALVMIMQYILGAVFLPPAAQSPLAIATGPLIALFLALSLYFLVVFVIQLTGKTTTRGFSFIYLCIWGLLLMTFALTAGKLSISEAAALPRLHSLMVFILKIGTVFFSMIFLLFQARVTDDRLKRQYFQYIGWIYLAGFSLFQLSVSGFFRAYRLPHLDYLIAFLQIGYQFPVLIVLSRFLKRQSVTRPLMPPQPDLEGRLSILGISQREAEIVALILRGFSNKEIAENLFISLETVKKHIFNVYKKVGVKNRLQLSYFIQHRLGSPPGDR